LYDVYARCEYRLPDGARLPGDADADASELLDQAQATVRERLDTPLAEIFPPPPRSDQE